ncbi:diguanylate cyclase [Comamonas sp. NoAH]|uniref:GGDEF domain-containing response regulator n=1 Tax=Comamonas halotolerans TaxID=3041496 RepID=UPI0024E0F516|nr:diguanylate cyclase [Comamonas sp. NoAH]
MMLDPSPALPQQATILIVDDERLNRATLAELLQPHYRVLLAKNGISALEIAVNECAQLALVLLDVSMPGMSGYEVLQALRADKRTSHIPVIFITGQSDEAAEEYGLRLGAADYVSKPIRPAVLQARAKNQVDLFLRKRELEQLALADGLTGLANRRHFDEMLEHALRRSPRSGEYLGLALMDIDLFKQFNDHYGHLQGDDALRAVAQAMRQHAQRAGDCAARYGGEEFAFVSLGSKEALPQMVKNFRSTINCLRIPHAASPSGQLTVSAGIVVCSPQASRTVPQLLEIADSLLYQAKAQGRDRMLYQLLE